MGRLQALAAVFLQSLKQQLHADPQLCALGRHEAMEVDTIWGVWKACQTPGPEANCRK